MFTETRSGPQTPASALEGLARIDGLAPVNALAPALVPVRKPQQVNKFADRRQWRKRRARRFTRD